MNIEELQEKIQQLEIENKKLKANKVSLLAFAITNKLNKILNYGKN